MSAETAALLRERLAALAPQSLDIEDESHRHAGHAGARDGGHYKITIVAAAFIGIAIGVITIGHRLPDEGNAGSRARRSRTPWTDVVHHGRWGH